MGDGLFFTFVTLSTIGFGDLCPPTGSVSAWVWLIYTLFGLSALAFVIGAASDQMAKLDPTPEAVPRCPECPHCLEEQRQEVEEELRLKAKKKEEKANKKHKHNLKENVHSEE